MTDETSDSDNSQIEMSETNLHEFREMVDVALNLGVSGDTNNDNTSAYDESIDQALLSFENNNHTQQTDVTNSSTALSVAELPSEVADSLNVAAKRLSLLYGSVVSTASTEHGEQLIENENNISERDDEIASSFIESYSEQEAATIPKPTTHANQQPKRHIMISYNRSSRETCQKIYERLVEQNYKVWMDLTDMFDDILAGMAHAVENSYIVLLCINQQYYESEYCKLEAEYAAENRIKFIPCLMEKSFRAQSWLGIIKGSNVHIDFSTPEDFDTSFNELVRQITFVEKKLSLQPRRTPGPDRMVNPMVMAAMSTSHSATSTFTSDLNSRRFDAIIREYKRSIKKKRHHLNRLKRTELSDLIVKLRHELFTETSQALSDSERSDDEDEKKHNNDDQFLQQLLSRSLDQNEVLMSLVDRLTTPQPMERNSTPNLDMDGIIKVILAIMLLWTLNILCQKKE